MIETNSTIHKNQEVFLVLVNRRVCLNPTIKVLGIVIENDCQVLVFKKPFSLLHAKAIQHAVDLFDLLHLLGAFGTSDDSIILVIDSYFIRGHLLWVYQAAEVEFQLSTHLVAVLPEVLVHISV